MMPSTIRAGGTTMSLALALGFMATVAMWAIGYVSMVGVGLALGELLFLLMLCCLFAVGFIAARMRPDGSSPVRLGALVGFVSATVNLLIIGSLIERSEGQAGFSIFLEAVGWILGLYVVSILLSLTGAVIGSRFSAFAVERRPSDLGLFSIVAAATVFLLLITGGLVTGLEQGLAVPDWPNSFGHNMLLYPISEMTGGVYYEHAHRLYGMLVGVTTITLLFSVWRWDRRMWLRMFMILLLLMVCVQGLMGGLRVTGALTLSQEADQLAPNLTYAIIHGTFAQIIFASFLFVAAATSRRWTSNEPSHNVVGANADRAGAVVLLIALLFQLILGASFRHLQIPATETTPMEYPTWALHGHVMLAAFVTIIAIIIGLRSMSRTAIPILRNAGLAVLVLVGIQVMLGVLALITVFMRSSDYIPMFEVVATTAHQVTGALLFGATALILVWSCRLMSSDGIQD